MMANASIVESGSRFEVWQGPQGVMRLDWAEKGAAVRVAVGGHGHAEFAAPAVMRFAEKTGMQSQLTIVCDFWAMSSYDSAFRMATQEWGSKHRKWLDPFVVCTKSKIVAMGISVAELYMGVKIRAHTTRRSFDSECERIGLPVLPPPERR